MAKRTSNKTNPDRLHHRNEYCVPGGFRLDDQTLASLPEPISIYEQWNLRHPIFAPNSHATPRGLWMQSSERVGAPGWSAVLAQKALKIAPVVPLAPGKPQRPGPAAPNFAIGFGGGVNDNADWMNVPARSDVEQSRDAPSGMLGRVASP
jgi:hypothetical protein